MIERIFNSLSRKDLSDEEKIQGIATLFQHTIDSYTDDQGKIYMETIDVDLGCDNIKNMTLCEIDEWVENAAWGNDLILDLMLLRNFAIGSWGASEASLSHSNGIVIFKVSYPEKEFKKIIYIEE